jgi:cholesterol transport system auxiliary component
MSRATLIAASLWLVGCVTSQRPPNLFDLGDFTEQRKPSSVLAADFVIEDVIQPTWIRSRDIVYRLDYESPSRAQRYAMSRWVAVPGELVTLRLRQAVQAANAGFTLPAPNGPGSYFLQANLEEFTQVFDAPSHSHCIVQLRTSLRRADGRVIGQNVFHIEVPAPTPDASGAALCLASAVNRASDQIVEWMSAVVAGGVPSGATGRATSARSTGE